MYLEKFDLSGRTALVTGGSQGIGLACVEALCEAQAKVILTDISAEAVEIGKTHLANKGYQVNGRVMDVTDSAAIETVATDLEAAETPIDILICNAGIAQAGIAGEEMDDSDWLRMMDVNLNGVFRCCRTFGRSMVARRSGTIVNIGSMSGDIVNVPQQQAHYNAAKAGVHHLTRSFAVEWAEKGVRINAVAPTYVNTPLLNFARNDDPELYAEWMSRTPMKRAGEPEEIASVVLFLASAASSLLTGSIVAADGGYTCI